MEHKSNKTAPLLKMLTKSESGSAQNPIMNEEFKEEMIHARKSGISAKKMSPEEVREVKVVGTVRPITKTTGGINIVSELVQEWLPETLVRFKCCGCDICRAEMTVAALNAIPPKYVVVESEADFSTVEEMKVKYRPKVIRALVKLALVEKNSPRHPKSNVK